MSNVAKTNGLKTSASAVAPNETKRESYSARERLRFALGVFMLAMGLFMLCDMIALLWLTRGAHTATMIRALVTAFVLFLMSGLAFVMTNPDWYSPARTHAE